MFLNQWERGVSRREALAGAGRGLLFPATVLLNARRLLTGGLPGVEGGRAASLVMEMAAGVGRLDVDIVFEPFLDDVGAYCPGGSGGFGACGPSSVLKDKLSFRG